MITPASIKTEAPRAYAIQGRDVRLPVHVRDASSGAATFMVSAAAVRRLIPEVFDVPEILPGKALCSIAVIEYRDNDLGQYNEVSITLFVRERGAPRGIPYLGPALDFVRGRIGTYIHWLPVTAGFTCEAGRTIWGFPKTVEQIEIRKADDRVTCTLTASGVHVLTLALPRGGTRSMPETPMITYSFIEGTLHQTSFTQVGEGFGLRLGGAQLTLGNHRAANQLRSLGLPKRAVMSMWLEQMRGRFEAAARVTIGPLVH